MQQQGSALLRIELKYCEACGGLWLRRDGAAEVYCRRCRERMGQIARGGRHAC